MVNATAAATSTQAVIIPYWMLVVWCIAGFLVAILIVVAMYYCYVVCCHKKKQPQKRSYSQYYDPRNLMGSYPQAFIEHFYKGGLYSRTMFSPSFVDHMRIPRAMEVKIVESVSSLSKSYPLPAYNTSIDSPVHDRDSLDADIFSYTTERKPPSREQSFRYQDMSSEESKERIYREKLLVSELREKLRSQMTIINE
ncbi:uncharacterized protein [Montipora foliosa]|uniref:uncharacterized protein n=1 Tax=Montipora foliosa TaxID=591990 RepID=UPI0035F130C3